ncbi:uncharacterized protein LOC106158737 [Lingula anatina]|uniref:Uncharacterized protein LOC106158737 n=1 Tax=Lingula anatina TaxID=7574 RepID=A0A1S3HXI4_LINAN|nr:uncharacterized protein LOC106158737 [Lingula anatina]|eukprot:XP_013390271.1 uncharacterized protein LOC106158737 [Lingula anatina]
MSERTIKYKDLTRPGEAVSLLLADGATVGEVKYQIKTHTGIPQGQQTLFYRQNVLRDEDTLYDLSIPDNATLKLLPRESIKVNVQTKQGRAASFRVRLSDTVSSVKMRIQQEANVFLGDRHLSYAGREMADDLALSAYGLKSGSILTFDEEKTECYLELANGNPGEDSGILDSSSVESDRQYSETVTQLQNDLQLVQDELQAVQSQYHTLNDKVGEQGSYMEGALAELRQSASSQFQSVLDDVQDVNGNQETLKLECLSLREKIQEQDINVASATKEIQNAKDKAKRTHKYIKEKNAEIKNEFEQKTACIERNLSESSGQVEEVTARLVQVEENLSHVKEVQEVEMEERLKLQKELEESESIRKQFMQSFKGHQTLVDWVDSKLKGISEMSDKNLKVEIKSMRQDFSKKTSELDHTDDALAESLVRHKLESQEGVDFADCFQLKYCKDLKMLFFRIWYTTTCVTDERNKKFKSLFLAKCINPIFLEYVSLLKEYTQHVVQNTFEATVDQKQDCVNSNDLKILVTSLQNISEGKAVDNKVDAHLAVCRLRKTLGRKTKLGQKNGNDIKTREDLCKRLEAILTDVCPLEEEEYYKFHQQGGTKNVRPFEESKPTMSCYVHALLHKVLARSDALPLDVKAPMELEVDVSGRVREGTEEHERIFTCGEFKARIKGNGAKAKEQTTNYVKIVAFICNCLKLRLVKAKCMLYYLFGREAVTEKPVHEQLLYTFDQKSRQICFVDESENHERGDAVEKHAIRVVYEKMKME